jgi:hypothetical protein
MPCTDSSWSSRFCSILLGATAAGRDEAVTADPKLSPLRDMAQRDVARQTEKRDRQLPTSRRRASNGLKDHILTLRERHWCEKFLKYDIQQLLLSCGAIAGPFFIVVFLIEGAPRNRYDPLREAVSALAIGPRGWVQQANFIVTGALMFAYAFGLSSALRAYGGSFWAPLLVGIYALGLIGAGIFVTDRPGLRDRSAERRKRHVRGILHDVCSLFAFIPLFIAFFVLHQLFAAAGAYGWAVYSGASAVLFGVGFILFVRGFASTGRLASIRGLFQRITIAIGWIWLSLVAAHLMGGIV